MNAACWHTRFVFSIGIYNELCVLALLIRFFAVDFEWSMCSGIPDSRFRWEISNEFYVRAPHIRVFAADFQWNSSLQHHRFAFSLRNSNEFCALESQIRIFSRENKCSKLHVNLGVFEHLFWFWNIVTNVPRVLLRASKRHMRCGSWWCEHAEFLRGTSFDRAHVDLRCFNGWSNENAFLILKKKYTPNFRSPSAWGSYSCVNKQKRFKMFQELELF